MSREAHVRFWEGVGVQFPRATRLFAGVRQRQPSPRFDRPTSTFTTADDHVRALTA
jgi:hypothetical protein